MLVAPSTMVLASATLPEWSKLPDWWLGDPKTAGSVRREVITQVGGGDASGQPAVAPRSA